MKTVQRVAFFCLMLVYAAALAPGFFATVSYDTQDREHPRHPPSREFLLGSDDLGRDRFARLLYGMQVSLLLAPAAALCATAIAAVLGGLSSLAHPLLSRALLALVDVVVSVPWLFLLLTVRAILPLNVSAWASVVLTFSILGLLGWAPAVRAFRAASMQIAESDYVTQAYGLGCARHQVLTRHMLPNLLPVMRAQFWALVPVFVLAEANLSMLGLGVADPMPSLGNLMAELQNYSAVREQPWIAAPAVTLALIICAMQSLNSKGNSPA